MEQLNQALEVLQTFRPISKTQVAALLAKTAKSAVNGDMEPFRATRRFDSTWHNPKLGQPGTF